MEIQNNNVHSWNPDGSVFLREDERIDDLELNGLGIIQRKGIFCFGMDAVLLCGFIHIFKDETVLDLGTGTGIIPLLLSAKSCGSHFTGVEIQDEAVDMAIRSIHYNGLDDRIRIIKGDIKEVSYMFDKSSFDCVVSNPPYMNLSHGLVNPESAKAIARHEIKCTLADVLREGTKVLKPGGRFYLVHRPRRLSEIFCLMKTEGLEPKRMKFVYPYINRDANMVLIEAVRGGNPFLKIESPLIVFNEKGEYTEQIRTIYGY